MIAGQVEDGEVTEAETRPGAYLCVLQEEQDAV
jgi:hypothetical protein